MNINGKIIIFLLFFGQNAFAQYDFNDLIDKIQTNFKEKSNTICNDKLEQWVNEQNPNGSWKDFYYGINSKISINDNHLLRLLLLAKVVTEDKNPLYNDGNIKAAIITGLKFWESSNTSNSNWWWNEIYFPQRLGEILITMREFPGYITKMEENKIIDSFRPKEISMLSIRGEGANMLDIAMHYIYRAVLTKDSNLLQTTIDFIEPRLANTINEDYSFQEHGKQMHFASYGYVYTSRLIDLAYLVFDTPAKFNVNSTKFSKVLSFIREIQIPSVRGNKYSFSTVGRAISRENGTNTYKNYSNYLNNLEFFIDTIYAKYYQNVRNKTFRIKDESNFLNYKYPNSNSNSLIHSDNKHYNYDNLTEAYRFLWTSDFALHTRKNYTFTVRMHSCRTLETEVGNSENIKGNYLNLGANFISVDGNEYFNIMPLWDWSMIPGITFKQTTIFPKREEWGKNSLGSNCFVGGVSDGKHGVAVMDMLKDGVNAKKSWFFFEDEIVCLGAGINDTSGSNIRSTINQSWYEGNAYISTKEGYEKMSNINVSVYSDNNLRYVRHAKIGYYFMGDNKNITTAIENRKNNWYSINKLQSKDTITGNIFSLWVDHGSSPSNCSYSYIIVPNITNQTVAEKYAKKCYSDIEIINNSPLLQAVINHSLKKLFIIFYKKGKLTYKNYYILVDKPCVLIYDLMNNNIWISDPNQKEKLIKISIKSNINSINKTIELPLSEYKGSSKFVNLD